MVNIHFGTMAFFINLPSSSKSFHRVILSVFLKLNNLLMNYFDDNQVFFFIKIHVVLLCQLYLYIDEKYERI